MRHVSRTTRRLLFYILVVLILAICVVFVLEWRYVEKLKEAHESEPIREVDDSFYKPRVKPNQYEQDSIHRVVEVPKESRAPQHVLDYRNLNDIYTPLKKRKQYKLRVEKTTRELWWYVRNRLNRMDKNSRTYLNVTLNIVNQYYNSLRLRYDELESVSPDSDPFQLNWKYWQRNISHELTSLMERRIRYLQNPPDCEAAKKLVCHVAKACGFGCQIHHVSYCFIIAYATKRTLVVDSSNWRYSPSGWDAVFQPLSTSCSRVPSDVRHFDFHSTALAVSLPPVDSLQPRPSQLPMAIPRDLSDRLMSFHGSPFAWFVAQFLKYLMRPSSDLAAYLRKKKDALGIGNVGKELPIVGVHVRRTDKRAEARYHEIEEYMVQVEEWYDWYQLTHTLKEGKLKRRVFIATDEPRVILDAKSRYPTYEFFGDSEISSLASKIDTRYSMDSLFGLIFDVTMLSECNYIVCTFSSQVCRLAYELMQNHHVDASNSYYSIDDVYYFGGQQAHDVIAVEDHKPVPDSGHSEIPFHIGDRLGIAGNEKTGYSVGIHRSTHVRGDYPSYKVEDQILIEDFPPYEEVG